MMLICKNCKQPIQEGLEAFRYNTNDEAWHVNCNEGYLEPIVFEDEVNKPSHYHKGGIDVIGYLEQHFGNKHYTVAEGFAIANVIKYVSRYKEKGGMKDLKKAEFYVKKLQEYENE